MQDNLITAIVLGHGDPVEAAICRVILGVMVAVPFAVLLANALILFWPQPRRPAYRYDRITDPRRPRR